MEEDYTMFNDVKEFQLRNNLIKLSNYSDNYSGSYEHSFFRPFCSFSDAKLNVIALLALPIINLCLALEKTLEILFLTTIGVANIAIGAATFDLEELIHGYVLLKLSAAPLRWLLYYAVSIFTDTLVTFARLVTHSLATVASGIALGIEAISECFSPSSTSQLGY
jgi:hypothetical protein